jgi:hypothetical protein
LRASGLDEPEEQEDLKTFGSLAAATTRSYFLLSNAPSPPSSFTTIQPFIGVTPSGFSPAFVPSHGAA